MSDSHANTVVQFLENFTSRKFFALVILVGLGAGLFWAFESFTGHFSVGKTSQEVDVLEKIVKLRVAHELSPEEEAVRMTMLRRLNVGEVQLSVATSQATHTSWISALGSLAYKGVWGASPWILLALLILVLPKPQGKLNKGSAALGAMLLAFLLGAVAIIIPSPGGWWVVLGVPWILFFTAITLIVLITLGSERRQRSHDNAGHPVNM